MTQSETVRPPAPTAARAGDPRRLHRLTLVFEALTVARAFLLPAIVAALGTADDRIGRTVTIGLAVLSGPALLAAIGKYLTFRYRLIDDELVIDAGVISHRRRVIPLARVQNIDVRQNLLQRIFGVAELRVETAGGEKTEASLSVLARAEAEALRTELLRRRVAAPGPGTGAAAPSRLLARLPALDLAIAGATANEAGLVAAGLAGAVQLADDLPIPIPDVDPSTLLPDAGGAWIVLLAATILLVFAAGWLLSIAGAIVGYHDFTLELDGEELRKRYGLLARREATVPLRRVQLVRVEESLLRRPLGLAAIRIETAGAAPGQRQRGGAEAFLPIARRTALPELIAAVFPDLDYAALRFRPVHHRARRRLIVRYAAVALVAAAAISMAVESLWPLALLVVVPFLADRQYRSRRYALAPGFAIARAGYFNRVTWIVPERKIQTLQLRQTPFQRRSGLATLLFDTAGGGVGVARVADLGIAEADAVLADLTVRVARLARSRRAPGRRLPGESGG